MALTVANVAMADRSYFYIENTEFPHYKHEITVPVKAHFDGRVSGFQIEVTYPEGLTPTSISNGRDITLSYLDANGEHNTVTAVLRHNEDLSLLMTATTVGGWDTDGNGDLVGEYGVVKWEAGDYEEMFFLTLSVDDSFESGKIHIAAKTGSGTDTRGGTVTRCQSSKSGTITRKPEPDGEHPIFTFGQAEVVNCEHGDKTDVLHGDTIIVPVSMTNDETITAFQADLYLPEGFQLVPGNEENPNPLSSDRMSDDHELYTNVQEDGAIRMLCYSPSLQAITGNEGELFYITIATPFGQWGDFELNLSNIRVTTTSFVELNCGEAIGALNVLEYLKGDANNSRKVTVTDVVVTAQHVLGLNPDPFLFGAADMNEDSEITVTDVVLIANKVLHPYKSMMRAPVMGENNDALSADDILLHPGENRTVSIELNNDMEYTAFQFDLLLPEGVTASNFRLTDRAGYHELDANMLPDGRQRVMCYSAQLSPISGNHGGLLTFDVTATGNVSGDISVEGIEMVTTSCQTVAMDSFSIKVRGEMTAAQELTDNLRIFTDGNNIIVESPVSLKVVISDMMGRAFSVNVDAGRTSIPAQTTGVVVVTANGKATKLMLK